MGSSVGTPRRRRPRLQLARADLTCNRGHTRLRSDPVAGAASVTAGPSKPLSRPGTSHGLSPAPAAEAGGRKSSAKGFKPKIRIGAGWGSNGTAVHVTLRRTRLKDIGAGTDWNPKGIASWKGARRAEYYETYYAGNLGHYSRWACGVSQAGYAPHSPGAVDRLGPEDPEGGRSAFLSWDSRSSLTPEEQDSLDCFRDRATVNSLMIIASGTPPILPVLPRSGPDLDVVRTLIKAPGLLGKWKLRRQLRKLERED
ncbi:ETEC_3214 domain-containing protein [Streptomyces roseolus]|uniref:ETEC_3214 domain-containing protein n=1 Tax=Streptomyces roseolus TaxID=67358 RepID=UPI0037B449A5